MLTVLNDVHIGAIRVSGTTPTTQLSLRQKLLADFEALLPNNDLLILGDLFDKENIPMMDLLKTYWILADWLLKGHKLYLVAGNHDLSKTSSTLSSFDFLCNLLCKLYPTQVVAIRNAGQMTPHGYVIPHVANQDLFNLELEKVPVCDVLYLHCNYHNFFATQSDHSLNLSQEQAQESKAKHIVIAHEHHKRQIGKVTLPGNQIASSVADWTSVQDKYYATVTDGSVVLVRCIERAADFIEIDWQELKPVDQPFIRVIGKAEPEQAAAVVTTLAKYRQVSTALVISNNVTIGTDAIGEAFSSSLTNAEAFSVWEALKKILSKEEIAVLEKIRA